ncbi:glycosyltransferase [Aestuariispira ectoiniformans]|uniref:glycosyltransferase n=1 Tax=Aestuariispira ectoiniformans TaxID=2775080 RepID=UPI00223A80D2|nr:glycosyltransferase [Aestuariispira ectoiniformans]
MTMLSQTKLLCFLSDLDGGGAQRTMVNIVNQLANTPDLDIVFVVAHCRGAGQQWVDKNIRLIDLASPRLRSSLFKLVKVINTEKPDIVFSTMLDSNVVATLATRLSRQSPRLVLRETNSHRARNDLGAIRKQLAGWAYRQADRVIALSNGVADEILADCKVKRESLLTLPNPVDVSGIKEKAEKARLNDAPFSAKEPTIISVGRLTTQKNFDLLISAFSQLKTKANLIILGEGPDRKTLEAQVERLHLVDRVMMPGFVKTPEAWLSHADLFVLSSRWEGFGHVIVEAMACGAAVIATDCPHGPRDIITSGKNGILVPMGDKDTLSRSMDEVLQSKPLRDKLSAEGSRRAEAFELNAIVERYKEALLGAK